MKRRTADSTHQGTQSATPSGIRPSRSARVWPSLWRWALRLCLGAVLLYLAVSAVAPMVRLDEWPAGMPFTHVPRVILAPFACVLGVGLLVRKRRIAAALCAAACCGFIAYLGWGDGRAAATDAISTSPPIWTLLSLNTEQGVEHVTRLRALCRRHSIDVLSLQEVNPEHRQAFADGLPEFSFQWADPAVVTKHSKRASRSLLVGCRKDILRGTPLVETAITGYRTLAVRLSLGGDPLWLVNVHTTKPIGSKGGLLWSLRRFTRKAALHNYEGDLLQGWLQRHADVPVVVAGDFNSPYYSRNVSLDGTVHAHLEGGTGPHLTFPRGFPVFGLDHVLGNHHIAFRSYEIIDAGFSDHLGQLVRFEVRVTPQGKR